MNRRVHLDMSIVADAILVGCSLRPQQAFELFWRDDDASCAVGAMIDGMREMKFEPDAESTLAFAQTTNPETGAVKEFMTIVMDLNDLYRWPRERIAAWARTLRYDLLSNSFYQDDDAVLEVSPRVLVSRRLYEHAPTD